FGQTVIVTKGLDVRDKVRAELQEYLDRTFVGTDAFVKLLDIGPPVGKPVQYRLSGPDIQKVRELGQQLSGIVGEHQLLSNMVMDWNEPTRVVKVDVLQDKARQLGVSSEDIANAMNSIVEGSTVTQVRDDIYLVNVVARAQLSERGSIETLQNL
ncbi:efflux RND transporter permease subunit, partial [Agrobacterium sp. S2]|nr:efflux RND transporter permease subunit [Agrobacterium sp. S2]